MVANLRVVFLAACLLVVPSAAWANATFTNSSSITLPSTSSGAASATPSHISVAGLVGTLQSISVTIRSFTDPNPEDIYFELVAPNGDDFEFLGGAGGTGGISGLNVTLQDGGTSLFGSMFVNGTFGPTVVSCVTMPSLAHPNCAPPVDASSFLSVFSGIHPNGTWSLYIYDPVTGDAAGSINSGWSLNISTTGTGTTGSSSTPEPGSMSLLLVGLLAFAGLRLRVRKNATA
jgi:hypothetical protein